MDDDAEDAAALLDEEAARSRRLELAIARGHPDGLYNEAVQAPKVNDRFFSRAEHDLWMRVVDAAEAEAANPAAAEAEAAEAEAAAMAALIHGDTADKEVVEAAVRELYKIALGTPGAQLEHELHDFLVHQSDAVRDELKSRLERVWSLRCIVVRIEAARSLREAVGLDGDAADGDVERAKKKIAPCA